MTIDLLAAMLDQAPRYTNFFNGRLLTAEDLRTDQAYHAEQRGFLGRAIGAGVVEGLEVSSLGGSPPSLKITEGLALVPKGQPLVLNTECTLRLVQSQDGKSQGSGFVQCDAPDVTATLTGTGVYILVVGPASGFKDQAPVVGEKGVGSYEGCGAKYGLNGVYFNLIPLDLAPFFVGQNINNLAAYLNQPDPLKARRNLLRSWVAHYCFGTAQLHTAPLSLENMIGGTDDYGAIRALYQSGGISDCEVALGALLWTQSGIEFIDMFAARRRPVPSRWTSTTYPGFGPRHRTHSESLFNQFQGQLKAIPAANRPSVQARNFFHYLPPAGILPVAAGFNPDTFFGGFSLPQTHPRPIFPDQVMPLIRRSFDYLPFNVGKRAVFLYRIVVVMHGASPPPSPAGGATGAGGVTVTDSGISDTATPGPRPTFGGALDDIPIAGPGQRFDPSINFNHAELGNGISDFLGSVQPGNAFVLNQTVNHGAGSFQTSLENQEFSSNFTGANGWAINDIKGVLDTFDTAMDNAWELDTDYPFTTIDTNSDETSPDQPSITTVTLGYLFTTPVMPEEPLL